MCGYSTDKSTILGKRLNQSQGLAPNKKIGITTSVCKCKNCGLIFSNPQPIPKDIQDHYGIPPESYWTENYFKVSTNYFSGEIMRLRTLKEIKKGMKSLDIGAGIGKQMKVLESIGFETYGIEPSQTFYNKAISKLGILENRLKMESIEDASYPADEFDFISFGVVLEHIYKPSQALNKALNWLKPGGLIHIEVPSSNWLTNKIINFLYRIRGLDYTGHLSPMHEPFHLHEFSLESFKKNATINGYEIVFHEHYVCNTYLPKFLNSILKPLMKWTNTGMQLCVWLKK